MTIGITPDGHRFISREGKEGHGERYLTRDDIPTLPKFTPFSVAAAIWFGPLGDTIHLDCVPGDCWNVEITYPGVNVIPYRDASITFLTPLVNETTGDISTNPNELNCGELATIEYIQHRSDDGLTIQQHNIEQTASIRCKRSVNLPDVSNIVEWLAEPHDGGTIEDVLVINLNKVKKCDRPTIQTHRAYYTSRLNSLLTDIQIDADGEGIVVDVGGLLVKIVPHWFVESNQIQHAVRNCIKKRTFGTKYQQYVTAYIPNCPMGMVNMIERLWEKPECRDRNVALAACINQLRILFLKAYHSGAVTGDPATWANAADTHNSTLVEFATFIEQLDATPVNTL